MSDDADPDLEELKKELLREKKKPKGESKDEEDPFLDEIKKEIELERQKTKPEKKPTKQEPTDELSSLQAELESERKRHGLQPQKKPSEKPPEPKTQPKTEQTASSSDDLDELRQQLKLERTPKTKPEPVPVQQPKTPEKKSVFQVYTPKTEPKQPEQKPTQPPKPPEKTDYSVDDDLAKLRSELEAERQRHGIKKTKPQEPEKPQQQEPEKTKPIVPIKPVETQPIPEKPQPAPPKETPAKPDQDKELDDLRSNILRKKATPETPTTKDQTPEEVKWSLPGEETEQPPKPPKKKSPIKAVIAVILILSILGVAVVFLPKIITPLLKINPEVKILCWDGTLVAETSQCPPQPTTLPITIDTNQIYPPTTDYTQDETTTTLSPDIACYSNPDCKKPTPYVPFCDGIFVKTPDVKYVCVHPTTPQSYCQSIVQPPKLVKSCQEKEYCWAGECYPEHCRNKKRDIIPGEQKIDCGGPCRACNETDILCTINPDCGTDICDKPYCNKQANPTQNCTRNVCIDPGKAKAYCMKTNTVEIIEICGRGRYCINGQDDCMEDPRKANCHDCIQNQGENGIDCGGPCLPCASKPVVYDALNLTATKVVEYHNYKLKLDRLIRDMECSNGAKITLTDPYGVSKDRTINRQENAQYFDLEFGMLNADTNSVLIWIRTYIPQ